MTTLDLGAIVVAYVICGATLAVGGWRDHIRTDPSLGPVIRSLPPARRVVLQIAFLLIVVLIWPVIGLF